MKKPKCEAKTELCSDELVVTYYNPSGKPLKICGACAVYLRRGGAVFSQRKPKGVK